MKPNTVLIIQYINTGGLTSALPGEGQRCAIKEGEKMNFSKKHIKAIARNVDGGFVLDHYGVYILIARNFSNNKTFFRWEEW